METNNPFWKMSVVQAAPANAPGAYSTPFRGGTVTVTNMGRHDLHAVPCMAPHTVDVIQGLTDSGFYTTNTIFHRVVPGFVIQGGDPDTNGMGGLVFQYDDEYYPKALFTGKRQLALANSGKDTDGSQFFVTVGPQRALDFDYTIFGQLLRGFDVLTNIGNVATNGASRPLADVIIADSRWSPTRATPSSRSPPPMLPAFRGRSASLRRRRGRADHDTFREDNYEHFQRPSVPVSAHRDEPGCAVKAADQNVTQFDLDGTRLLVHRLSGSKRHQHPRPRSPTASCRWSSCPIRTMSGPPRLRFTVSSSSIWNHLPTLYP